MAAAATPCYSEGNGSNKAFEVTKGVRVMDMTRKNTFMELWAKYFPGAELPITFYYWADAKRAEPAPPAEARQCFIASLGAVRKGESLCFDIGAVGCFGGKRYLGFSDVLMPNFEYFLSCGIEGKLEGERYKKTPEIVGQMMKNAPALKAPAPYVVMKRWDKLEPHDEPEVVIFLAPPDVLSGLVVLAGFDESDVNAVITPFCAGCGSIALFPYLEKDKERPRSVVGMFDVSARPWVQRNLLSFATPMKKFVRMIDNMPESFLTTHSWEKVRSRM